MNFPNDVKYTKEHEWIRLEGDVAYVGITDYAQEQLGDIVFVDIQTVGETLAADEVFGTIEVVKPFPTFSCPLPEKCWNKTKHWKSSPNWLTKTRMAKAGSSKSNPLPMLISADCWMQKHTKH